MGLTPAPCVRALQMVLCEYNCYSRTKDGPVPGAQCFGYGEGLDQGVGVFGYCDDGEGYCPAPDCKHYGQCVCPCHT